MADSYDKRQVYNEAFGHVDGARPGYHAAMAHVPVTWTGAHLRCSLYIADTNNNVVRKISPSGIITTFAGTGYGSAATGDGRSATAATLWFPGGLTVGPDGR